VIGAMSAKGAGNFGNDQDDVVFIPLSTGMLRIFGQRFVRSITVAVSDLTAMDQVQDQVTTLLRSRHNNTEDFFVRNMAALLETATSAQNTLTILLGSVAAISLLVGGIGVMNIMLVSVTERTREIGIRRAIGAKKSNILFQFIIEAITLCQFGGIIGIVLGVAAGNMAGKFLKAAPTLPLDWVLAGIGLCVLVGVGFGTYPAWKAANLDPIESLRYE
jgi:macrolide transport system ATP-binding/permease protein